MADKKIDDNKSEPSVLIDAPNGSTLVRKVNPAGGYIYLSDDSGALVEIWHTVITNQNTLLAAIVDHEHQWQDNYNSAMAIALEELHKTNKGNNNG